MLDELNCVAIRNHFDYYEKDTSGNYTSAGINQIKADVDTLKRVYANNPNSRDLVNRMHRTMQKYYYDYIAA